MDANVDILQFVAAQEAFLSSLVGKSQSLPIGELTSFATVLNSTNVGVVVRPRLFLSTNQY